MGPQLTPFGSTSSSRHPQQPVSLVIFTVVDGVLRDPGSDCVVNVRPVVELLLASQVPVVFISDGKADALMAWQQSLGVRHPCVAEGGAELYVPQGYFQELEPVLPDRAWERLGFRARGGTGDAVSFLMSLYRLRADPMLFVGLGESWKDRALLRAVDVPVIVRNDALDQARLARSIPAAYFTTAAGPAGWSEAILGSVVG